MRPTRAAIAAARAPVGPWTRPAKMVALIASRYVSRARGDDAAENCAAASRSRGAASSLRLRAKRILARSRERRA
ncbi:hypothetical protein ACU686_11250 [Yinghuangia aomiensis]